MQDANAPQLSLGFFNAAHEGIEFVPDCNLVSAVESRCEAVYGKACTSGKCVSLL
jgi:hypothetical protein